MNVSGKGSTRTRIDVEVRLTGDVAEVEVVGEALAAVAYLLDKGERDPSTTYLLGCLGSSVGAVTVTALLDSIACRIEEMVAGAHDLPANCAKVTL